MDDDPLMAKLDAELDRQRLAPGEDMHEIGERLHAQLGKLDKLIVHAERKLSEAMAAENARFDKMEAGISVLSHGIMDLHERLTTLESWMARMRAQETIQRGTLANQAGEVQASRNSQFRITEGDDPNEHNKRRD